MLIGVKDSQSDLEKHYKTFCGLYEELAVTTEAALNIQWCKCGAKPQKEKRKSLIISLLRFLFSDPLGARTQDPNIKSVVLYLLS